MVTELVHLLFFLTDFVWYTSQWNRVCTLTDWQNSLRLNSYASLVLAKNFTEEKNYERYYVKVLKFAIWKLTNANCIIFKNLEKDCIKTLRKYLRNAAIKIIINIRAVHYSVAFTLHQCRHYEEVLLVSRDLRY